MTMKNVLLASVSCFLFSILNSQNYRPMAVEGAHWIIYAIGENGAAHHAYSIDGDTLIGGVFYKKMYKQHLKNDALDLAGFSPPYLVENQNLTGAIRDDVPNKKVYFQSFTGPLPGYDTCDVFKDVLIYDFSVLEAGTLDGCLQHNPDYPSVVDSISYQFLFGEMRKSFYGNSFAAALIEAVGTGLGPFWPVHFYVHPAKPTVLVDYCVGKHEECNLFLTPANEVRNDWQISIFPNPAHQQLTLEVPDNIPFPILLKIHDPTGQLFFQQQIREPAPFLKMDLQNLPTGIFTLSVCTEVGMAINRFVKQ